MALCIDTYCPLSDEPPVVKLEDYWASHLGTGTLGNYDYVPAMSYQEALAAAREEESKASQNTNSSSSGSGSQEHSNPRREPAALLEAQVPEGLEIYNVSSSLPKAAGGSKPLNVTSFVGPVEWQLQRNYLHDFESVSIIGNCAGVMAMGNVVALFLFAGTYETEIVRQYWIWGIVGTVAVSAILPSSQLWVRQRFYELFLALHIILSLLFIIGYYYHIWYVYEYKWGYEIWVFVAGTGDIGNQPQAQRQAVPHQTKDNNDITTPTVSDGDPEKTTGTYQRTCSGTAPESTNTTVFFSRTRGGITKALAAKASPSAHLRVLLEGPYYHSGNISPQLAHCVDMLCIAGGVGITACLPFLRHDPVAGSTKLFWSSRHKGLVTALAPAIGSLPSSVRVETVVGERLKLETIILKEMVTGSDSPLAIIVYGPPGMADNVRSNVVDVARSDRRSKPYVLVDEAFACVRPNWGSLSLIRWARSPDSGLWLTGAKQKADCKLHYQYYACAKLPTLLPLYLGLLRTY
ncbi:hypothetical protein LZ30DRAFT_691779 [Colletotrichum cereale]|nr:hypothetical protein LZ30DRAFT_691779 [Colletotrichum cereale]